MGAIASQITRLMIVYWTVYSDADQRKHHSSVSLAFVRGIHRWPVNHPHRGPVTQKMFPFDDVIMSYITGSDWHFSGASFNSLNLIGAYMRQHNIPTVLQIMACPLFNTKPLYWPMLVYCQLDPKEHSEILFKILKFSFKEMHLKMWSAKRRPSCLGLNVLRCYLQHRNNQFVILVLDF